MILTCVILFFVIMTKIGKKFKDSQWKAIAKLDETYDELALPEVWQYWLWSFQERDTKTFLILYLSLENSTTSIAIMDI